MRSSLPDRVLRSDFARYFAVSIAALLVDIAVLSASLRLLGLGLALSASLGFTAGATLAYVLSTRWAFRVRTYRQAPALEFAAFVAIGIAGLGVTQLVLWLGTTFLGMVPELVKLAAAGATFAFNYAARKSLLFMAGPRAAAPKAIAKETPA